MLLERAELQIREGMEREFSAAMADRGLELLTSVPGVRSVQLGRGVENPQKFMLLVEWDAMESHVAFTKSPVMAEFRALLKPFSTGGATEHFKMNGAA
jgi:heme-degrading monooxygenase HmoA